MAGRGEGATHGTAGGSKKRNKERKQFRTAFEKGVSEGIIKNASAAKTANLNFAAVDVPDFTPRKTKEQPGERQYQTGDTGGSYGKKDRQWKISYRKQAYLNRRLAELDEKKRRDQMSRAGSGTRTKQTK